jgi:hypothetical protein
LKNCVLYTQYIFPVILCIQEHQHHDNVNIWFLKYHRNREWTCYIRFQDAATHFLLDEYRYWSMLVQSISEVRAYIWQILLSSLTGWWWWEWRPGEGTYSPMHILNQSGALVLLTVTHFYLCER